MTGNRSIRFFVGIHEIGDLTLRLSQGLRHWGFQVTNVVLQIESPLLMREKSHDRYIPIFGNKYVSQARIIGEFLKQFLQYDVFVFNFGLSFTGYMKYSASPAIRRLAYVDLAVLRSLGKKIVIIANGDDIRSRRLLIKEMEQAQLREHVKYAMSDLDLDGGRPANITDEIIRESATKLEKYADHIFARPISAQFLTRDYHLLWLPADLSTLRSPPKKIDPPLIVHAPSNSNVKGTKYVLGAIEKLRRKGYEFHFELCKEMTNTEVRQKLASAQIAIDQLILPGYGLFAVEAMASGCAVLGSAVPGYNGFPMDLPIMTTTPDTIYQNLKRLLENQRLRVKMAQEGRVYVEKNHDHIKVARRFLQQIGEG